MNKKSQRMFIAFEGIDGSGKSTQVNILHKTLINLNFKVIKTNEPCGTTLGIGLQKLMIDNKKKINIINKLKSYQEITTKVETLIFAASRAHHVECIIKPALKNNIIVITDRYIDSSLAYQGKGNKKKESIIKKINDWSTCKIYPNLTILLDIDPAVAMKRRSKNITLFKGNHNKVQKIINNYQIIRNSFLKIAKKNEEKYLIINANYSDKKIAKKILYKTLNMLSS